MVCLNGQSPHCLHGGKGHKTPHVVAAQMRRINNLIFRQMNEFCRANGVEDITAMHGWILSYLYDNSDRPIFQRDVEKNFSITRSTVTNILQLMEHKGYIRRESVPEDARLKRLVLTDEGAAAHEKIEKTLHQTNIYLNSLLTGQEQEELLRLLDKLGKGLAVGKTSKNSGEGNLT